MLRPNPKSAVVRARWLAELAATLDEAHRLTVGLAECRPNADEAVALGIRIQAMRSEVASLRCGNYSRTEKHDPLWSQFAKSMGEFG